MGNCVSSEAKESATAPAAIVSPPSQSSDKTQSAAAVRGNSQQPKSGYPPAIAAALQAAKEELTKNEPLQFAAIYKTDKIVGHGAFAKVMVCQHRRTKQEYAVKVVYKNADDPDKQREGIIKEIAIMRTLGDHPNTVKLHDVFEDSSAYMLIMELCAGGELFDQIIQKGHFSEKEAAEKMCCLVDFIRYAHSKNIIHRDLKPENILLSEKGPAAVLKVIDFGTSDFCLDGQRLQQKFGTPYYVAPEVLKKDYDKQADIWSSGVIMYILLCGYPPFGGKTDEKILQKVASGAHFSEGKGWKVVTSAGSYLGGTYSFEGKEWEVVTEAAKDMITHMLVMDPAQRSTAEALLKHRWFQVAATAPAAALGAHMVRRLQAFSGMARLKRLALVVLARTLTDNDVKRLRELFVAMDRNNDGSIDYSDLHAALEKVGAAIDENEMRELFTASDVDGSGKINYDQFIAAMLDTNRVARRKDVVRRSFEQLDTDGDGFISPEDLVKVTRGCSIEQARAVLSEVDGNQNGRVDYAEFEKMMMKS